MLVSTRPEEPTDEAFLRALIMESISEQLMASQWPEEIRGPLLETQYRAKRHSIRANYPHGESLIILGDEEPIGWLFSNSDEKKIRVVEIVIHSRNRSKGMGTALLRSVAERAGRDDIPVGLSVGIQNQRAFSFYLRLGFQRTGGDEVNHFLIYRV